MATTRDSALYDKLHVKKYLGDPRDRGGRAVPIALEHTVVAGEVAGDFVNLGVIPANCMVVGIDLFHDAAASTSVILGDAGDDDRYLATTSWAAAGSQASLAGSGQNYRPTADTVVQLKWVTVNPTVGAQVKGVLWVVPGA